MPKKTSPFGARRPASGYGAAIAPAAAPADAAPAGQIAVAAAPEPTPEAEESTTPERPAAETAAPEAPAKPEASAPAEPTAPAEASPVGATAGERKDTPAPSTPEPPALTSATSKSTPGESTPGEKKAAAPRARRARKADTPAPAPAPIIGRPKQACFSLDSVLIDELEDSHLEFLREHKHGYIREHGKPTISGYIAGLLALGLQAAEADPVALQAKIPADGRRSRHRQQAAG